MWLARAATSPHFLLNSRTYVRFYGLQAVIVKSVVGGRGVCSKWSLLSSLSALMTFSTVSKGDCLNPLVV